MLIFRKGDERLMFENLFKPTLSSAEAWFDVLLGIGTVFIGLLCIILLCKIVGLFFMNKKAEEEVKPVAPQKPIENRQEIIAAVSAAAAEELGTDISAIRILSFKRI